MAGYRFDNFKIDANNPTGETPSSDVLNLNNDNLGSQEGMAQANTELQEKYNSINQQVASGQIKQKPQMNYQHQESNWTPQQEENDGIGTKIYNGLLAIGNWEVNSAMDVYRNLFNPNARAMNQAKTYADTLGLSAQFLMDNPDAYDTAEEIYNKKMAARFLGGVKFSTAALDDMYPELAEIRQKDPVSAAMALQDYEDVKNTRSIFEVVKDAFNSGSDMVKLSDAQMRAYNGESIDSVRPDVDKLTDELRAYQEPNKYERTLYDTIQQLTIMGTQAARATKRAAQGAALGMATSAAAAGGAAATGIGAPAAPAILMAGAATGAAYGMRVGMFEQFEQQSAAARYWELMNNRKGEYSRNHALVDSTVTGVVNGAIELGLMEVGYKPITKAWGGQAAKSILNNAAARMAIIDAGKESIARLSAQAAMKQFGRSTAAELAEEGAQQASEDLMDNAEYYLYKKGAPHTTAEIIGNAVDAMVQAVPAVVGMGAMGAITHGVGNYRGMRAVAAIKNEDWKQEYRRTVEQQTIEALMANKAQNKTAQKNPEVYKNVVQEQARLAGVQNMYVDAQELSKTDKGVDVLNDMVNRGIITGEQVDKSISTGADIVIPTGTFAQLADESVDTDTLMRATTMAKNGVHRAALEEKAKRVEAIREELANLAQNKKDALSKELMEEHFKDADDITRTAAESVIYKNPYDLNKSYKEALADVRKEYEDALGFDAYWNYKPQGVGIMYTDEESRQTGRGIRVSNNDYWYQDMYKKLGRKATREEMLDIAYEDQMKELQTLAPETADEFAQNANSLKAKYESLQGLKDKFEELAKSDYAVKQSLTKEGYEVYNEVLNKLQDGSAKSKLAANENAFIYARMAESWAKIRNEYGDTAYTAKDFMAEHAVNVGYENIKNTYTQAMFDVRRVGVSNLKEFLRKVKARKNAGESENKIMFTGKFGVVYTESQVVHATTAHKGHVLTIEQLEDIEANLDKLHDVAISNKAHLNKFGGASILAKVKGYKGAYYVVLEIDKNGKIWFKTGQKGNTKSISNIIKQKITEGSARSLTHNTQGLPGLDTSVIHINTIAEKLKGVNDKEKDTFNQRAWHGSGTDFNEFNLEKALTGAGDMVHGWGIYTAKNKKTAQAYKKHAKSKGLPSYLYEVDIPENENLLIEEKRYEEQPSEIKEKLTRTISGLPDEQQKAFWGKLLHNEMRTFPEETEALSDLDKAKDKVKQLEVAANGFENTDKPKLKEKIAIKHLKALGYIDKQIQDRDFMRAEKEKEEKVLAAVKKEAQKAEASIQERKDGILEAAIKNPKEALKRSVGTGKEIYKYLSTSLGNMEEASQQLNKNGIEGISYYDSEDGDCVVVFSDKAVNIVNQYNQRAWHGTPYDFDAFNLSGIGSGEGNQAHGWGLYFAQDREVSEAYKQILGDKGSTVELNGDVWTVNESGDWETAGKIAKYGEAIGYALDALEEHGTKNAAISSLQKDLKEGRFRGTYIAEAQKAVNILQQGEAKGHKGGRLLEAEIPDMDVLLDEQKSFKEQPEKVKSALSELISNTGEDQLLGRLFKNATGKSIYKMLSNLYGDDKRASLKLNEFGVKGITYKGTQDERCYVVFDDKAITIRNKYDQEIKASYNSATGAIHLFDGADQSSFVHEAAHMYLTEMGKMATDEAVPKGLLEDWNTIQAWAAYKPEDIKDYEGTAREKEFKSYAKAIKDARKSGDVIAIRAAEERWMQERFARGFERYIAEGKAPTQALQSAFRKFKSWLVSIYRDLTNLGKEPPEDVKRVMDRMLATNDEIEAWAKAKELDAWDKKGFSGDLTGSEGDMIKRWAGAAKEKAKERVLKELMRQEENQWRTDLENSLEKERIDYERHLVDENPIYGQELQYNETDEHLRNDLLRQFGYDSKESFESAIEKAGGPLEERSKAFMENRRKEYEEIIPTSEDFKNAADAELASTNAQMRLSQLEAYAIKRKVNGYVAEAVKAMRELDALDGKSEEEITAGIKEILGVDDEEAKKGRQVALMLSKNEEIQKLKERLKDAKEKDKEHRASAKEELASAKAALKEAMRGLNTARDITAGSYTKTLQAAREELSKMTVAEATTWRHWEIKAKQEGNNADRLMAAGAFEEAAIAKSNSLKYYCMSRAAKDNQEYVRTKLEGSTGRVDMQQEAMDGIKGMVKRISRRENPVRLDPNSRYMIQHLAYITGITEKDGIKPLNEKGESVGINWEKVYGDLNPDYAMDKETAPNPDKIVAPWLRILAESKERKDYNEMQMDRFQDMVEAMNVLYKSSRRDYEATTIKDRNGKVISQEEAAMKIVQAIGVDNEFNPLQDSNDKTNTKSKAKSLAKDALLYLTKAETVLERFGGECKQLVYEPINQAANKELEMRQKACKVFSKIYNMYSLEEWQAMRSDRVFAIGLTTNFTREQLICMALNWGNKEGRKRVLSTINKSAKNEADVIDEYTMQSVLESSLTDKDWNFIEAIWTQLDSYWAERNKVQENLYGQGLGKVQALPFNINGRQIKGGYYPIVYDPKLSIRASDLAADDIVKQALSGSSTFGIGMGSTKSRVSEVKGQQLALRLDVWPQAVTKAIHHIAMREAATDVYKLITHPAVQQAVQQKYGMETYNMIRQWSKDVWKTDVQKADIINRTLEQMRKNSAFAVMAMRTGTALLNVLNVFPMMHQIGRMNTLKAITSFGLGFYKGTDTYARNRQFVFDKSPMMRDRMNTIDRDMQQDMKLEVGKDTSLIREKATHAKEKFNRFGYWFITETDLMFSMALWKHSYDESMRKQIEAGITDVKQMERNAISDADTNVRAVFGSGQVKDQVAMQRKNTLVGQLTPFYSYSSTVLNALIKAGYRVKDHGDYMALINATLYWVVLQTLAETVYRSAVAGELDDPDKMLRRLGITTVRNVDQGLPVVRDALEGVMNHFLLGSDQNNSPLAITAIDELVKATQAAGNEKKDFTDIGRSLSRVGNRTWKFSDTLSDGFWNLVRFSLVDTDRSVQELITTTIFDKRYKTHEERVRQDKKKANEQKRKENKR
nr:MAG TPA: crystallin beta/gamma motif-containing protein [Caudoviricetes sp.]